MADRNRGIIHDTQLDERAEAIRGAQTANFNSAERVGSLFADIIQYIDDHEEEWLDKGSGDGSVPSGMGGLINSLWKTNNPAAADQILHWNGNKWEYITTPSGGTGGGISLSDVWNSLGSNEDNFANRQIHAGHLSGVLKNYVPLTTFNTTTWWGQTVNVNTNKVTGDLVGNINSITFGDPTTSNYLTLSYDVLNNALKVSKGASGTANFYATGGVSALGYSAGGSGGEEGVTPANLNAILSSINNSTYTVPASIENNSTVVYNSSQNRWELGTISSGSSKLSGLSDVDIQNVEEGQILRYNPINSKPWENVNFSINDGEITLGNNKYTFIKPQDLSGYATQEWVNNKGYTSNVGTVTSVGLSAPTGFTVSGSPITENGTLSLGFDSGYSLPTTATQDKWTNDITALETRMTTAEGDITGIQTRLNTTTWWGHQIDTTTTPNTVKGDLVGDINRIVFGSAENGLELSYDTENHALKLSRLGSDEKANFYATGGVSALGYSSDSDSGDDSPTSLGGLLTALNSLDAPSSAGYLHYTGQNYVWDTPSSGQTSLGSVLSAINTQNPVPSGSNKFLSYSDGTYSWTTISPGASIALTINGSGNAFTEAALNGSTLTLTKGSLFAKTSDLATVATTGNYGDLKNTPTIPEAQVSSDWNAESGVAQILNKPTTLAGYGITDAASKDVESYFDNGVANKAKDADTLDGYNSNYFATAGELATTNGNVDSLNSRMTAAEGKITTAEDKISTLEGKFTSDKSAWGNPYLSNGEFQDIGRGQRANINNAGSVNMGYYLAMEYDGNDVHDPAIYMKTLKTDSNLAVLMLHNDNVHNTDHHLAIGYGTSLRAQLPIKFFGRNFLFNYTTNSSHTDSDGKISYDTTEAMMIGPRNIGTTANPVEEPAVYVRKHLMVGDGSGNYFPVTYDYANNALCFSGNIYATGGVSALGFSSTANGGAMINGALEVNGDVSARNNLNVANGLTVSGNAKAKSLEVGTASLTINAVSGDLEISGGEEGVCINTNFYVDSEGEVTTPSITSTNLKATTIMVGANIKIDTTNGLQAKVGNTWYKLDIQAAIQAGLFTQVQ